MVLVGILVPLYRYSMRLSAFYFARADLMRFVASTEEPIDIDIMARALTPSFNFGKEAVLPAQHVTEIVRDIVKAAGDRAGKQG
jgi:hypothetical protein